MLVCERLDRQDVETMGSTFQSLRQSRRARLLVPVGVVLVAGAVAWGGHRWATSEVLRRAADAGLHVKRGDVSVRLDGSATLRNATWSAGPLSARIEVVDVDVALLSLFSTPRVERIAVTGVEVVHDGARSSQQHADSSKPRAAGTIVARVLARLGGTPPEVVIDRFDFSAVLDAEHTVNLSIDHGIGRTESAQWRFTAPTRLIAPSIDGVEIPTSATVQATMNLAEGAWSLESAGLRFDEPMRISRGGVSAVVGAAGLTGRGDALLSDVEVRGVSTYLDDLVKVSRIEAGPLGAILARAPERLELVRVTGADVTLQLPPHVATGTSKGNWNDRFAATLSKVFARADEVLAQGSKLGTARLEIVDSEIRVPDRNVVFSVHTASLQNLAAGPEGHASLGWSQKGSPRGRFDVTYATHKQRLELAAHDFDLSALNELAGRPIGGIANGTVTLGQATTEAGETSYPVEGKVRVNGLRFQSAVLSSEPIEAAPVQLDFAATYIPRRLREGSARTDGVFTTSRADLRVGKVQVAVRPAIIGLQSLPDELPDRAQLAIDLEPTSVQHLLEAVPPAILGPLKGARLSGMLGLHGRIELPLHAPERLKWDIEPELADFRIVSLPNEVDVRRLMTSATYTLADEKLGHERTVFVPAPGAPDASDGWTSGSNGGCGSYVYVPLDQISPHLASGVLSTEDRGFLWHDGFNVNALRESLAANLAEGHIVRGGSTITMQLVKNLFLDRQKTVSRKLREVFLTWLTESVVDVPKSRILEVYFNVIEYGPKVIGIWHAATYFFGKQPRDLTVGEVAWFITTLTGPKIYHHQFLKRQISDNVWGRMRARIDMLYHNDYITELDLVEAKAHRPAFRPVASSCAPHAAPAQQPSADDEVLAAELLRLRRSGLDRAQVTQRVDDPAWRARTLAARRARQAPIDWGALPLARDKYSWWSRRQR